MNARWATVTAGTAARRTLAARGEAAVAVAFYVLVLAAVGGLWRSAAESQGGAVAGYSAAMLTWYIAASEAATVALDMRMIERIGDDIAGGAVAAEMLRPAPPLAVRIAAEVGRALPRLAACALVGAAVSTATVGGPPDPAALALALPALPLAVACNIAAQHTVAAAAFWVRDARSSWFLYQKLIFITGGMLLPLEVMPDGLRMVAAVLPFAAMSYAPARLASGHVEPALLAVQVGWLAVLLLAAAAAFAAGQRRLQAVGS